MAPPPPTSKDRDRDRHHHHRTISSTTLLLVLSLILAVLAVMLSLPGSSHSASVELGASGGWLTYLTPRRTHGIIARESAVAVRESEVARREAELLAFAPGGYQLQPCIPGSSPSRVTLVTTETLAAPAGTQTVIKEIVETIGTPPVPAWFKDPQLRIEDVLDREHRVSEREKDVGSREETVGKRETDASRRESWILEQLIALGNDPESMETEVIYPPRKSAKMQELPATATYTTTVVHTVTSAAAHIRRAPTPVPEDYTSSQTQQRPAKTLDASEEPAEKETETVTVVQRERHRPSVYGGPDRRWWW